MKLLLMVDNDDYRFEELIVGEITKDKMNEVFRCNISVQDYLSFFRMYMFGNLSIEKDLGNFFILFREVEQDSLFRAIRTG